MVKNIKYNNRKDVVYRKNYLRQKLLTSPKNIFNSMPKMIGPQFQGEWALYSCSMFAQALANIAIIYPETKEENIETINELITNVLSEELKKYDAKQWNNEDPIDSLEYGEEIKHLSYRSHLAWMICNYKIIGGDDRYDNLLNSLCSAMAAGIKKSPSMLLPTYIDMAVYLPDMMVALVALNYYNKLSNGKYKSLVDSWIYKAKTEWVDEKTGLLSSYISYEGLTSTTIRGSYSALNTYYLALIDKAFAEKQYQILKKTFVIKRLLTGCREYPYNTNKFVTLDVDAGPIILDISPSGTAFLIGCATIFGDYKLRKRLLTTANIAGCTFTFNKKRHYLLSNLAPVGEAIVLAMKTSI